MDPAAVDPQRPWYPVEALTRANVTVEISTAKGLRLLAKVARHGSNGRWFWMEQREDAPGGWSILVPWWAPGLRPRVLGDRAPLVWRPVAGVLWPDALPAAAPAAVYRAPEPVEPALGEGGEPVDGWPAPGLHLGRRGAPESTDECAARLLRAIRTMRAPGVVAMPTPDAGALDSVMVVFRAALAVAPDPEAWTDHSHIPDVAVAWTPDKRDLADWDYALAWLTGLPSRGVRIVMLRAAAPVWSWRQIADRYRISQARARQIYAAAIAAAYANATGETA